MEDDRALSGSLQIPGLALSFIPFSVPYHINITLTMTFPFYIPPTQALNLARELSKVSDLFTLLGHCVVHHKALVLLCHPPHSHYHTTYLSC